ncbi:MAG: bifunctional phosphopantothenoylcysteine decarboxylase/phosphopantothenate--cysteine ligase CoaBC, partial [Bacilli bacterium]
MAKWRILIGVTGGIAAFKAASVVSALVQRGHEVRVCMTRSAEQFVGRPTFQAISRGPVYGDVFQEEDPAVVAHIDLADWADAVVVCPCTANTVGKVAGGIADDMLTNVLLATRAPVYLALAMNVHMYQNAIVQQNMKRLAEVGYTLLQPEEGFLACGYVAKGRMLEPEQIVQTVIQSLEQRYANRMKQVYVIPSETKLYETSTQSVYSLREVSRETEDMLRHTLMQKGCSVTLLPQSATPEEMMATIQLATEKIIIAP